MADDIFREVDDEVRAERFRAAGRRFGWLAGALVLIALAAVAVWQWRAYLGRERGAALSSQYFAASKLAGASTPGAGAGAGAGGGDAKAQAMFAGVAAASGPDGLRTLARLREASLAWRDGGKPRALAVWAEIAKDRAAPEALRGLADLLWVQHQVSDGDPSVLKQHLGQLSQPGAIWRPMAQELDALLDLREGHITDAKRKLLLLSDDGAAPEGLRSRAAGLNDTLEAKKTAG